MYIIICIVILILNAVLCYEDIRDQEVDIWPLVLLFGCSCYVCLNRNQFLFHEFSHRIMFSGSLLLIIFCLLKLYIGLKYRRKRKLLDKMLGKGDLWYWISLMPLFNTYTYALLLWGSLVFSLLVYVITAKHQHKQDPLSIKIPLVGYQAIFYATVLLINMLYPFEILNRPLL